MKPLPLVLLVTLVVTFKVLARPVAAQPARATPPLTIVVSQALALLGHAEQPVVIFDPAQYDAAHRAKLEQFEAFVFKERGEIYLNGHGKVSAEAIAGHPHGVYVLAAILAHEMAHLQGLDERGALEAERRCVFQFMKEGRIPVDVALEHFRGMWRLRQ